MERTDELRVQALDKAIYFHRDNNEATTDMITVTAKEFYKALIDMKA